jgi:hypothetical protein
LSRERKQVIATDEREDERMDEMYCLRMDVNEGEG